MTPASAVVDGFSATADNRASWVWTFPYGVASGGSSTRSGRTLPDNRHTNSRVDVQFAGFLCDHEATARELSVGLSLGRGAPGVDSETTIVAAAYQRWGLSLFDHLRGSFVAAITDPARRQTIVARDHMGLHPAFYTTCSGAVSIAASPKDLVRLPGVSRELNRAALADALCRRYPDDGETFFAAVRRVPPGSFLTIGNDALEIKRYWDPLTSTTPVPATEDEAFDCFEALQAQAVRRQLGVGRSSIFLSGGLDSVGVAAAAADQCKAQGVAAPIALSITFPGEECDERNVQTAVAAALNLPQCLLPFDDAVGPEGLQSQAMRLNQHTSSPLRNYWAPAYMEMARRGSERGATTVLTGEGGDEWASAPIYAAADLLSEGRFIALGQFLQAWRRAEGSASGLWQFALRPVAGRMLASVAPEAWDRRRARRLASGDPVFVAPDAELRAAQRLRASGGLGPARPPRGFAAAERETSLSGSVSQQDKEEGFVLEQLVGMRFLHPYHDPDLVAFFCQLPITLSNAGGWHRGLPRRQLTARFPGLGFDQQKKLFATSFHRATMRQGWASLGSSDLDLPTLAALGVVDGPAARDYLHAGGSARARRAWDLVSTEAWAREQSYH